MVNRGGYLSASPGCFVQRCVTHVILYINISTNLHKGHKANDWLLLKVMGPAEGGSSTLILP